MPFSEDIQVRMGLDRRPFDKALKGATGALGVFKGALGAMGASFSLGALKGFLSGIFDLANDLKRTSQALDVSTDFIQDWRTAVGQSGGDVKTAAAHLERFTQRLAASGKAGSDVEVELRKVADQMAAQPDPIKRAKIAFDAFGKGAAELIPLLSGGSKGLDAFRARVKLTTAEIERLDKAQADLALAKQDIQNAGAKGTSGLMGIAETLGAIAGKATPARVGLRGLISILDELNDERAEADRTARLGKEVAKTQKEQAIAAEKLAEQETAVGDAYKAAHGAQVKADFDALTAAQKLNVLLEYRLQLLRELAADNTASIPNARKLGALPGLSTDINKLKDEVGPGAAPGVSTPGQTTRDRAVAANPRLAAMLAEQERKAGMTARDLAIDASPRMGDFLGNHPGPRMQGPGNPAERTATAVEELLKKAETVGLLIRPTNGE